MNIMKKFTAALFAAVIGSVSAQDAPPAAATLPPASTKTGVTFATDIKPIFDAACVKCHGDTKPRGGINLTTLAGVTKGGKDGPIFTAGDSTKGDLIASVAHTGDPSNFMPKGKAAKKLTDDQIGLIRAWIDQGAK